jgi:hypothetical protein
MSHYIVYHNPDKMPFPASESALTVLTNKTVSQNVCGSTIWLITGEGRPRQFYLVLNFIADVVESGEDEGFRTRVRGEHGHKFDPMVRIDDQAWFGQLKRRQGNFAFGFNSINDDRVVAGFETLVSHS